MNVDSHRRRAMRTLIVYESMYGNTRRIAEAITEGLMPRAEVDLMPVAQATPQDVAWADLRRGRRANSCPWHEQRHQPAQCRRQRRTSRATTLHLEPEAEALGIRDWLASLPKESGKMAVAFDTRIKAPSIVTGRASVGIAKALRGHGFELVTEPESSWSPHTTS